MFYVRSMNIHTLRPRSSPAFATSSALVVAPIRDGGVPAAAAAAGLGARFRYWSGGSGRRYLFTAIDSGALSDFVGAIVVVTLRDGTAAGTTRVGVCEAGMAIADDEIAFVHLLSTTAAGRDVVLDDLLGRAATMAA